MSNIEKYLKPNFAPNGVSSLTINRKHYLIKDMYRLFINMWTKRLEEANEELKRYEQSYTTLRNEKDKIALTDLMQKTKDTIREAEKCLAVEFDLYSRILREYNGSLLDLVVYQGKSINVDGIGTFQVEITKVSPDRIDWPASNALRAEIIKRGEVPYNKETNPNGLKYHVKYGTTQEPFIRWKKETSKLANKRFYRFKPSKVACINLFRLKKKIGMAKMLTMYQIDKRW